MKRTFEIPEPNFYKFKIQMERFQKKAKKLGMPPLQWRELESAAKTVSVTMLIDGKSHQEDRTFNVRTIEIEGVAPKIEGWRIAGSIEFIGGLDRPIVNQFDDEKDIPDRYMSEDCKPDCDHCQTNRNRLKTYLVQNNESQEFKQIGSSCMDDFFPNQNPMQVAQSSEFILEVYQNAGELEDESLEFSGGASEYALVGLDVVMSLAVCDIRHRGFVSARMAEEQMTVSTAEVVRSHYSKNPIIMRNPTEEDDFNAQAVIDWLKSPEFKVRADESVYLRNLHTFVLAGKVDIKHIGIAASAPIVYERHLEKLQSEQSGALSRYVGDIGDKLEHYPVRLDKTIVIPDYRFNRDKLLMVFQDEKSNFLNWFCSGAEPSLKKGEWYHLSGKIAEHRDYKGTQQTQLQRCSFSEDKALQAIINRDEKAFKKAMKSPINVNAILAEDNANSTTLLGAACLRRLPEMVDALVNAGADPLIMNGVPGNTVLSSYYGTRNDHPESLTIIGRILEAEPTILDATISKVYMNGEYIDYSLRDNLLETLDKDSADYIWDVANGIVMR